ncbi:hypothetical protein MMC17_000871 [Xylographa soralifera]|nr:hypothetical protein [Xylographa soralifera]
MQPRYPHPLALTGVLDQFESFHTTPCLGIEFPKADLAERLRAPNSDEMIRDLAVTIAQRGVVFFRSQTSLTPELHKEVITRLGRLSEKPKENGLYKHQPYKLYKDADSEYSALDGGRLASMYGKSGKTDLRQSCREAWHSDLTFENNSPDFSNGRIFYTSLPKDTLWASGCELCNRLSKPYKRFLESLTAPYSQPKLNVAAKARGTTIFMGLCGSPENVGDSLTAVVFAVGTHVEKINDVTLRESEQLLDKIMHLFLENHDLQVRFRWVNDADMVIWDNRCTYHAPTPDAVGARDGWRVVSMGERPYLEPSSLSRNEALAQKASNAAPNEVREAKIANGSSGRDELELKRGGTEILNGVQSEAKGAKRSIDVIDGHQIAAC